MDGGDSKLRDGEKHMDKNTPPLGHYATHHKNGTMPVSNKGVAPGYFDYDGYLARRVEHGQRAEVWKNGQWEFVPNMAHFLLYEATRINHAEAVARAIEEGVEGPLPLLDAE